MDGPGEGERDGRRSESRPYQRADLVPPPRAHFLKKEKISVQEIRKIKKKEKQWSCQRSVRVQTETGRCPCVHCCGGSLMGLFVNYGSCGTSSCHACHCIDHPFDCSSFLFSVHLFIHS